MTDRIRVLEIIHGLAIEGPLGGIERFGVELVRALEPARIEPVLCALWEYGTPHERPRMEGLLGEGIQTLLAADWNERHPYRAFWAAWRGARQQLAGQTVDVIHSHCQFGDGLALLLASPLQAKALVRTVHNEREWPRRPGRRFLLTNLAYPLRFDLEMGVSLKVADNLNRRPMARLLGRHALCMYNAVNLERFVRPRDLASRQLKRAELGIPPGAPLVGSIGRLTAQKGYSTLLEAAAHVRAELPNAHLLIVGEGELRAELERQADKLGLADRAHLTGPRQDVDELLPAFDLFVSSSLWEGLPTVILESMAAGVPVVATDVSGTRELVRHGVTGLLVPPGDAAALAEAMLQALRQTREPVAWVERAAERVQDFSIVSVAQQHAAVYEALMQPSNPKGVPLSTRESPQ